MKFVVNQMNDVDCPYCGYSQEVCHDDGFGYEEDRLHEMSCYECEKNFVFSTLISFDYKPYRADCLNDSKHKFKPSHTTPKMYTRMVCADCDETRALTEHEWLRFMGNMETVTGWHK